MEKEGNDRESGGDPGGAAPWGVEGPTGDLHAGEDMSEVKGDELPACVACHDEDGLVPISELHAEGITHTMKGRVVGIRRLFVLASNVVETILPGR